MAMPTAAISSFSLMDKMCEALDLNPDTISRIILDLDRNSAGPVMAYVELVVTDKILKIDWSKDLGRAEIKVIDK